jgi:8-amino-7-oxononanoate synthase
VTPSLADALSEELRALDQAGLRRTLRPIQDRCGARVSEGGRPLVDFASNDYLGLASDPRLGTTVAAALAVAGTGGAAARLISGDHALHEAVEHAIADFLGTEAALLFSSGYMANMGAIPALVGRGDAVYSDAANHASLIDGCRLSRADVHRFPHANADALERSLAATATRYRRRLVVVEGIYSMDGDLSPLAAIIPIARRHGAWVYVDDAHGIGALGADGRGAAEQCGVRGEVDVWMGTLGKAFGSTGAFVAGSRPLIDYLCNRARTFVFTTASPPALAAAALTALEIVAHEPRRRDALRADARRLRSGLAALGRPAPGPEDGHIIPVAIGANDETVQVGAALRAAGFLVGAVRPPTVPKGSARLRITASAAHTTDDSDALLAALASVLPSHA